MFIKRQTSDTTSDNEWQRVIQRMKTSDTMSDNEWQRIKISGTTNKNEWKRIGSNKRVILVSE